MYIFLKLYIFFILSINYNISSFQKDIDISIILLKATWDGSPYENEETNNTHTQSVHPSVPPNYSYELPFNHRVLESCILTLGIPHPPYSSDFVPIRPSYIYMNSGRPIDTNEEADIPSNPYCFFEDSDNLEDLIVDKGLELSLMGEAEIDIDYEKQKCKKSKRKLLKLRSKVQSLMEKEYSEYHSKFHSYFICYHQYFKVVNHYQDPQYERAKRLREKLQEMYSFILKHRDLYIYYKKSLQKLDN